MSKLMKSVAIFLIFSLMTLNSFAFDDELIGERFNTRKEIKEYTPVIFSDNLNLTGEIREYNYVLFEDLINTENRKK